MLGVDEGPGPTPGAPRQALDSRNQPEGTDDSQKRQEELVARGGQDPSGEEKEIMRTSAGDAEAPGGGGKEVAGGDPEAPVSHTEDEALLKSIDQLTKGFKNYIQK